MKVPAVIWVLGNLLAACSACTIPVFRYALDRWPAEPWKLETPQENFTTEPLASALRNLGATSPLNLMAEVGNEPSRLLFPAQGNSAAATAWEGVLDAQSWARLTDSPVRRQIAARLLAGTSAVWVVAGGSDEAANAEFRQRLDRRLAFLELAAQLPVIDPNDPDSQLGPGPELKLKFSSVGIARSDAAEAVLGAMLAGPNGLAAFPAEQPFGALVFGRGRVLGAWPAGEISDAFIEETTLFLVKACSCQAKTLNPGWDLLMQVDWDARLREAAEKSSAAPVAAATVPEAATVIRVSPKAEVPVSSWPSRRAWLAEGIRVIAGVVILVIWLRKAR